MVKRAAGMEQRVSCIVLGVSDARRARRFYEAMGWSASAASREEMPLFNANGTVFILFDRVKLAGEAFHDVGAPACVGAEPGAFSGVVLTHVVREEEDVYGILERAVANGGRILSAAKKQPWGNTSGYFADPEGHVWEVSKTVKSPLQPDGSFRIGD